MESSEGIEALLRLADAVEFLSWVIVGVFALFAGAGLLNSLTGFVSERSGKRFHAKAERLFERDKLQELEDICTAEISDSPNNPDPHWHLGRAYYIQGRYDLAKVEFETVIRLSPSYRDVAMPFLEEMPRHDEDRETKH